MGGYGKFLGVGVSLDRNSEGREKGKGAAGRQIGRDHPWFVRPWFVVKESGGR